MTDDELTHIAQRALDCMLGVKIRRIEARARASEQAGADYRGRKQSIEACACEIRAQAFREAVALLRERELEPLRSFVSHGMRTAERRDPSPQGEN